MEKVEKHIQWIKIDQAGALKLTELTTNPGKVYQLDINHAPENFTKMKGACSYFVSAYSKPIEKGGLTIGGKMVIGRTDEGTLKNYPHYFASSSDNNVYFVKGDFHFPGHHIPSSNPINVELMFDHEQLSKQTKP
jgi:hypothetical protein